MKIGEDIKKLPAGEFLLASGLLFEINRKILHPFGLALVVVEGEDDMGQKHIVLSEGLDDYRKDPEGVFLGEDSFMEGKAKLIKFLDEFGRRQLLFRQQKFGYIVQHSEFDYILENMWKKVDNAKLTTTAVVPDVTVASIVSNKQSVPVTGSVLLSEMDAPEMQGMTIEQKNAILRAKHKIHPRGGAGSVHNTPTGVPCTNPVLHKEALTGGGSLTTCDTCGATISDSDMVQ